MCLSLFLEFNGSCELDLDLTWSIEWPNTPSGSTSTQQCPGGNSTGKVKLYEYKCVEAYVHVFHTNWIVRVYVGASIQCSWLRPVRMLLKCIYYRVL